MSAQHDKDWMMDNFSNEEFQIDIPCSADPFPFARAYHEHMIRWRELQELPEAGQRIEVAYESTNGLTKGSRLERFSGVFDDPVRNGVSLGRVIAWRPAGALPE